MNKLMTLLLVFTLLLLSKALFAAPNITLSPLSILPGESGELSLLITNNTDMAGLEFQLSFNETQVSLGEPLLGADLTASHTLVSHTPTISTIHFLIYPAPNNTPIPNGEMIKLPLTLLAGATAGNHLITIQQTEISDEVATTVAAERVTNGIVVDPNDSLIDSDTDGISDVEEVANNLHPLDDRDALLDFDADGLSNIAELQAGTDMDNPDTDGDGFNDGSEILAGTDPLIPDSPGNENNGEFAYVHTLGNTYGAVNYADVVNTVHTDSAGNVYQGGAYRSTLDFSGVGLDSKTSGSYNDAYVIKTNVDGTHAWSWTTYEYYGAYTTDITTDTAGNVYVGGYYSDNPYMDNPRTIQANYAVGWGSFVVKLDANGNYLWSHTTPGKNNQVAQIALDSQNNVYVVGTFDYSTTIDFNPGTGTDYKTKQGYTDLYVTRLNADGSYAWTYTAGGTNSRVYGKAIVIDSSDNILIGGEFNGTVDLDGDSVADDPALSGYDAFVIQLSDAGTAAQFNWKWRTSGYSNEYLRDMKLSGNMLYLLGDANGSVDYDPLGASDWQGVNYVQTSFITKIDVNGTYGSTFRQPTNVTDRTKALALDSQGNYYIGGLFTGTVDFDPTTNTENHVSQGYGDIVVNKYLSDGTYAWTKSFGGSLDDFLYDMTINKATGDLFLTGTFKGTVDFDPGAGLIERTSAGADDIFLVLLSPNPLQHKDSDGDLLSDVIEDSLGLDKNNPADAMADNDSDGLSNYVEYVIGTNLSIPDSDSDGIDDLYEHTTDGFNPTNPADATANFDFDGFTNYEEYLNGTDPNAFDLPNTFNAVSTIGNTYGTAYYADIVNTVHIDDTGNLYQGGAYRYTLDFSGSGIDNKTSGSYNDAYVVKTHADGSHAWSWTTYNYYGAYTTDVTTDTAGNVYIGGYYSSSPYLDNPRLVQAPYASGWATFVVKLDANGNYLWSHTTPGRNNQVSRLALDNQNNVYVVGTFDYSTTIDFNPGTGTDYKTKKGYTDLYVTRLNADGSYAWTYTAGGTASRVYGRAISIDSNGKILVAGEFNGTVDLDGDTVADDTALSGYDGFLIQLSDNGTDAQFNWKWRTSGHSNEYLRDMKITSNGIFLLGDASGAVDYNPLGTGDWQGVNYQVTSFITKIHLNGSYGNTFRLANNVITDEKALVIDSQDNFYIGGLFTGTLDFNPTTKADNHTSFGSGDIFITKYLADGTYLWTQTFGGTGSESYSDMAQDSTTGNLIITGAFNGTVNFDPGAGTVERTSAGAEDIFLLNLTNIQ